jgi:hypothetical protein
VPTLFFSYCHKDEHLRDRLEVGLRTMKRQGLIDVWHDRRIAAGGDFDDRIKKELERADVILLLVSPDFIDSEYCYGVEMTRAMERHGAGEARVIPIILRPCDWHPTPFGKLLAVPQDGKAITTWPDLDTAFLDVTQAIRAVLEERGTKATSTPTQSPASLSPPFGPRSSNLSIRKVFTEVDRDRFLDDAFEFVARFFEGSLGELNARNAGIDVSFRRIDANRFTSAIYQEGDAVSRCTIVRGGMFGRCITYSTKDDGESNSINDRMSVENDDQGLHLRPMNIGMRGRDGGQHLTFEGAAEYYWSVLLEPLQSRSPR